jgi:hypothetical protein
MSLALNGTEGVTYNDGTQQSSAHCGKNLIINGDMAINQRVVTGTVSLLAGAYGHDRFKAGAAGATYTFATTANVTTITITAGSLQQVVEGLNIQSGTHTLSWTGTAQGKIDAGSYSASGVTGTLTGGTNATVEFNTGTLTKVQLEVGTTATDFEHLQYGTQLALCQRYFQILLGGIGTGFNSTTIARVSWSYTTRMRASSTLAAVGTPQFLTGSATIDLSSIGTNYSTINGAQADLTTTSGVGATNCCVQLISTSNYFTASSEL